MIDSTDGLQMEVTLSCFQNTDFLYVILSIEILHYEKKHCKHTANREGASHYENAPSSHHHVWAVVLTQRLKG